MNNFYCNLYKISSNGLQYKEEWEYYWEYYNENYFHMYYSIIDEAQFIHNGVLNDLRLIFNFQMDSKNYAMVLLSCQVSFLSQLSLHVNEPLRQRITISYGFRGLSKDETESYLASLLKSAGVSEPLFAPDAVEAIFAFSNGLPRLINLLAEKSLLVGCQKQVKSIDSEVVQLAREDLDFLSPTLLGN